MPAIADALPAFPRANADYEGWLVSHTPVVQADLMAKHVEMAEDAFAFYRATFFRFAGRWAALPAAMTGAPVVAVAGDAHLDNFATWRDAEGRLAWGLNDFDEACFAPFTVDLARAAASLLIAHGLERFRKKDWPGDDDALAALLEGYRAGLDAPCPLVLEEGQDLLRASAYAGERNPTRFWKKLSALPELPDAERDEAPAALLAALPAETRDIRLARRQAGLGALGRPRFVALGRLHGSFIAREAKAVVPPVWPSLHAAGAAADQQADAARVRLLTHGIRCPDPFLRIGRDWQVRRLAPFCSKLDLDAWPDDESLAPLFRAMGRELANLHAASPDALDAVRAHLDAKVDAAALREAAGLIEEWNDADLDAWRAARRDAA